MNKQPTPSSRNNRATESDGPPPASPSLLRSFLDQHLVLFLALAVGAGFGCGALAVFVDGLSADGIPFLEWSVGLYVVPPVVLGWTAIRSWAATIAGSAAYLSAVLGNLTTTHLAADSYNMLEYGVWALVGLIMGSILGFPGNRIRAHATGVRAFAAGFPLGIMALFLWMSVRLHMRTGGEAVHLGSLILEGILTLLILALCRGWAARGAALVWALVLSVPFGFGLLYVFSLVWFASGDY